MRLSSATFKADKLHLLLIVDGSVGRGAGFYVGDFRCFPVTGGVELNCCQRRLGATCNNGARKTPQAILCLPLIVLKVFIADSKIQREV